MDALPPPYATSTITTTSSPYDTQSVECPYATPLPAFDAPRKYSSRLRRLLQQRSSSRGVYLTLHIPSNLNKCKLVSITSASSHSSNSSSGSSESSGDDSVSEKTLQVTEKTPLLSGLLAGIPLVEDLEAATMNYKPRSSSRSRKSKKSSKHFRHHGEKEVSWLAFFALLLFAFTVISAAAVFIAWATGFTSGKLAGLSKMQVGGGVTYGHEGMANSYHSETEEAIGGFVQHDEIHKEVEDKIKRSRVWRGKTAAGYVEAVDVLFT